MRQHIDRLIPAKWQQAWVIALIVFVVYLPSFWNTFVWDDEQFIQRNLFTTSVRYIPQIFTTNTIAGAGEFSNYYRPFTTLSFLVDRLIWGLRPFGFHLTNTALHAGAAVLLFFYLSRLGVRRSAAWWLALAFGLNPLQTEAVVYMNSRGDSWYVLWLMAALLLALRWLTTVDWRWYVASLCCFVAAILSKEIAVAGAGLLGLTYLHIWLRGGDGSKVWSNKWWIKTRWGWALILGWGSVVIGYVGLRLTVLSFGNFLNFYQGTNLYTDSLVVRLVMFSRALFEYWRLLILPYPLHMERGIPLMTEWWSWPVWGAILVVASVLGLGWWEWRQTRQSWIWFGLAWFFVMLGPVSGVVPINGLLYEHWLYLPMVGWWIMVGRVMQLSLQRLQLQWLDRAMGWLVVMVFVIWTGLTIRQNWIWRSPLSLYPYTLQFAQTARLHNNLAMAYADAGEVGQAIHHYQQAIALDDGYPQTHYNLGRTYLELNQVQQAEVEFKRALEINPRFDLAKVALLELALEAENWPLANQYLDELLQLYPREPQLLQLKTQLKAKL